VRSLWQKHLGAGIGIPTGEQSGWLVLDIDPRHGGDASLTALIEEHGGEWLHTMQARTGGGGHTSSLPFRKVQTFAIPLGDLAKA